MVITDLCQLLCGMGKGRKEMWVPLPPATTVTSPKASQSVAGAQSTASQLLRVPAAAVRQDFGLSATMRALQQKDKQDDAQGMRLSRSGTSIGDNIEKLWTQKTGQYLSRLDSKQHRGSVILGLKSLKVGSVHPQGDNLLPILLPSKVRVSLSG